MSALIERPAVDAARRRHIVDGLRALLPADAVLSEAEELRAYECDGLSCYREVPLVVALPHNAEQVQAVLRYCHAEQVPVVARGSGTGLSGGAYPLSDGVLLSLARLKSILDIDVENRCARVQPGVRNLAISQAVAPLGLFYAPDPSSQIACSIGGNVAENSGGVHCLKYGLTTHNLLKLEVVTADGERLTIGSDALDSAGYDLLALMTGSEGLLGVVVEITVKLLPLPQSARVVLAAFADVEDGGGAVGDVIAAGIIPAGMEMMDKPAIIAAEDFLHCGYPTDAEAILLVELDGLPAEVQDGIQRVEALMHARHATLVRVSTSEAERQNFWAGRKNAFPATGRISPDYYCIDGTIPRGQLPFVLKRMRELSEHYGQRLANVFHAGDGNLHPLILYDANQPGEMERTEQMAADILKLCVDVGGTITGEHGVGIEKINAMCHQFTKAELEQFHAVKHAFDPDGLLNPGKAIPTLHRCAEFGALHVHHGQLPHPELPRF
ncbi:MAG TPA: FAD-linked oxidase C-terminal domain-containing protein [Nevskiaceae bacterium]|nr:FAD-linked oxidase C-terminal domain-containing protein [Nevskiaceae bacterium]